MTELKGGIYELYPYVCGRCKEPTFQDLEELLKSFRDEMREAARKKAKLALR